MKPIDMTISVLVRWDDEARVYYAVSDDVPGLATEAESLDELKKKLNVIVPELLEENDDEVPLLDEYAYNICIPSVAKRRSRAA